ncbi:tyrosine-type recombinase/integrase [Leucobacter massiliensis]|nr:tyrosine-type recombinase/integrase [Leucobacter massiliensis]
MARKASRESWGIIDELPSGRYRARYTHQGERFNAPTTFDAKGDARAFLAGTRADIQRGKWKNPKHVQHETFGPYARTYIEQKRDRHGKARAATTKSLNEWYLEKSLAEFCGERLDAITPAMVRAWHSKRAEVTATSAAREASFMHAVFEQAKRDDLVEKNPVAAELTRSKTGRKTRIPTLEEFALIVQWFDTNRPKLALWPWLAAYGGPRKSEVRALRRCDLTKITPDADDRARDYYVVSVARQAVRVKGEWHVVPPKSEAGNRTTPLPAWMTPTIDAHLESHVGKFPTSLLFSAEQDEYLTNAAIDHPWRKAREYAGIGKDVVVRLHDLRGLALTMYGQTGATVRELQARGGHSTQAAAALYQHTTGRDAALAAQLPKPPTAPPLPVSLDEQRAKRDAS